jgi:hypothetical protein
VLDEVVGKPLDDAGAVVEVRWAWWHLLTTGGALCRDGTEVMVVANREFGDHCGFLPSVSRVRPEGFVTRICPVRRDGDRSCPSRIRPALELKPRCRAELAARIDRRVAFRPESSPALTGLLREPRRRIMVMRRTGHALLCSHRRLRLSRISARGRTVGLGWFIYGFLFGTCSCLRRRGELEGFRFVRESWRIRVLP